MKYILNFTYGIDREILPEWLEWMQRHHLPAVMDTGFFTRALLIRIPHIKDNDPAYAVQFECPGSDSLKAYYREHAPVLQSAVSNRFPGKVAVFGTELEVIAELNAGEGVK